MANYNLELTGDEIKTRLGMVSTHETAINNMSQTVAGHSTAIGQIYSGITDLNTANGQRIGEINDLQADVRYLRGAISMIGPGSGGGTGLSIVAKTQEEYDALVTKDANTLYIII